VPGAKKRVRELLTGRKPNEPVDPRASRELNLRAELLHVRAELASLLERLDAGPQDGAKGATEVTATITAVVPKTVLLPRRAR
jgi:hypothetical protein